MKSPRLRRWRRLLLTAIAVVLAAPLAVLLVYRFLPPPITPLMIIRQIEGEPLRYDWVPLDAIAPSLPRLVVAAEDNLFCRHWGFDIDALQDELEKALDGEESRGASTISMQVAKNLFLWPYRSFVRKGLEAWLTPYVELALPKRRIIEIYLNIAEWGPGIYGAEAAARTHFKVPAARLKTAQSSQLAAVLPNPRRWSASSPTAYIQNRAALYRQRAAQLGPAYLGCWR
ncbi:MAG: monofunctional biosynthetic peptidoglycan transglycosylase [Alphaproteobacteria bacterium]|nr:monofunctional biosynthetic peptidoglycan transglycosylase [Alphaproteobacteria bacterium]